MSTLDFLIQNKMTPDKLNIEVEYLMDNFIVKQSLINIFASGGMGKSCLMLGISVHLLDTFKIEKCYYLDMDNSYMALKSRKLDKLVEKHKNLIYFHGSGYKGEPRQILRDLAKDSKNDSSQFKNTLLVLDSIRNFTKDMINEPEVKSLLKDLQDIRDSGATVIFLHHSTKDGTQFKGVTSFIDSVDIAYSLTSKRNNNKLNYTLNIYKDRLPVKDVSFELDTETLELHSEEFELGKITQAEKTFIREAREALESHGPLTQSDFIELTSYFKHSPSEKTKRKYFKKYIDILWTTEVRPQENNSILYTAITKDSEIEKKPIKVPNLLEEPIPF